MFAYDGDEVRVVSQRRVGALAPPSDAIEGLEGLRGLWAELRAAEGTTLYRKGHASRSRRRGGVRRRSAAVATRAEAAYEQRDNPDAWVEEEPPEIGPDVRSVVSVRFSKGELGPIERAAAASGVPVSTYIRNAAINAVTAVDLDEARRSLRALQEDLESLVIALGAETAKRKRRRRCTSRPAVA